MRIPGNAAGRIAGWIVVGIRGKPVGARMLLVRLRMSRYPLDDLPAGACRAHPAHTGGDVGTSGLDAIDAKIVGMLADDARLSTRAIARAVGMSPTGVRSA